MAQFAEYRARTDHDGPTRAAPLRNDAHSWPGLFSVNTCARLRRMAIIIAQWQKGKWEPKQVSHSPPPFVMHEPSAELP